MIKIKKLGILSLGYAGAILSAIVSLLQIILIKVQSVIPALAQTIIDSGLAPALEGKAFWLMLLVTPLAGLIGGFIVGIALAFVYNYIILPITGGIKIELSEHKDK
mgnify:FL=1